MPELERALTQHLNRMGEHLVQCPALDQARASLTACSELACVAQLPAACRESSVRLLGAELVTEGTLTRLRVWRSDVTAGPAKPRSAVTAVQEACVGCDSKAVETLLLGRAGELAENREPTGGACAPAATPGPSTGDPGVPEPTPSTLLIIDLADRDHTLRAAVEAYLSRLGHQVVLPRHRKEKQCTSQECLNTLAQSYQGQGVTQILTLTSGTLAESWQAFVYDTESRRAEQRNLECEGCTEPQVVTMLAEAAGQLAVRCLREQCEAPGRAQASSLPEGACAPLPTPQCAGQTVKIERPSTASGPSLGRRSGAGVLIASGSLMIGGSFLWSLLSRTALNMSLVGAQSCSYMSGAALSGSCQISNYNGVDIAGYVIGAAAITGGVVLLKLPLERTKKSLNFAARSSHATY